MAKKAVFPEEMSKAEFIEYFRSQNDDRSPDANDLMNWEEKKKELKRLEKERKEREQLKNKSAGAILKMKQKAKEKKAINESIYPGVKPDSFPTQDEKNLKQMQKQIQKSSGIEVMQKAQVKREAKKKRKKTSKKRRPTLPPSKMTRWEQIKRGARRIRTGGPAPVYENVETGEFWTPSFMGETPPGYKAGLWKEVYGKRAKYGKDEIYKGRIFTKQEKISWKRQERHKKYLEGKGVRGWVKKRGEGIKTWATGRGVPGKWAWTHKGKAFQKGVEGGVKTTRALSEASARWGESLPGPFQVWTLAWKKMTNAMKWLTIGVFLFVLLFIPWGIFYYTGWAVAAAFMFLISIIYFVFVNAFNGIGFVIVSVINMVASIIIGLVIMVAETVLDFFITGEGYRWEAGHTLLENSLITYDELASPISLITVETPAWQSWFNTILIVKIFEHLPGLQPIADGFGYIGDGIRAAFQGFVETADAWQVVIVGMIPIICIIIILAYAYFKNRHYFY
jgi:hypothetical protein